MNNADVSSIPPAHIRAQAVANLRTSASILSILWAAKSKYTVTSTPGGETVRTRGQKDASDDAEESECENKEKHELEEEPEYVLPGECSAKWTGTWEWSGSRDSTRVWGKKSGGEYI